MQIKETFIDKLLRQMRLNRVLGSIKEFSNPRLLDVGCGFEARLLREVEPYISKGVGIDFKAPKLDSNKLQTISYFFEQKEGLESNTKDSINVLKIGGGGNHADSKSDSKDSSKAYGCHLPFEDESFEVVTMLAVIEHLSYPDSMLEEIERVLVPNGILLMTAPSHLAKPVLEFLAYKLKIIDELEIRDHKRYYNKRDFIDSISKISSFKLLEHKYFQCGMNNFCKVKKIVL